MQARAERTDTQAALATTKPKPVRAAAAVYVPPSAEPDLAHAVETAVRLPRPRLRTRTLRSARNDRTVRRGVRMRTNRRRLARAAPRRAGGARA